MMMSGQMVYSRDNLFIGFFYPHRPESDIRGEMVEPTPLARNEGWFYTLHFWGGCKYAYTGELFNTRFIAAMMISSVCLSRVAHLMVLT